MPLAPSCRLGRLDAKLGPSLSCAPQQLCLRRHATNRIISGEMMQVVVAELIIYGLPACLLESGWSGLVWSGRVWSRIRFRLAGWLVPSTM